MRQDKTPIEADFIGFVHYNEGINEERIAVTTKWTRYRKFLTSDTDGNCIYKPGFYDIFDY